MLPLDDQVKAVQREIAMRKNVYPKRIAIGKMEPSAADNEIAALEAVLATLQAMPLVRELTERIVERQCAFYDPTVIRPIGRTSELACKLMLQWGKLRVSAYRPTDSNEICYDVVEA